MTSSTSCEYWAGCVMSRSDRRTLRFGLVATEPVDGLAAEEVSAVNNYRFPFYAPRLYAARAQECRCGDKCGDGRAPNGSHVGPPTFRGAPSRELRGVWCA